MACSTSGPVKKKWWSSTSTGSPLGRHSRPAMGSRPSCSRFLVSTLITGSPSAWWSLTCSLRSRNWASRSGCWAPSSVLVLACRLNPSRFNSRPTVGAETGCPCRVYSLAKCRSDLLVRLDQREQGWEEVGVLLDGCLASPTWPADAAGRERRLTGLQLNHAPADGRLAHASHLRDRAHATVPQQPRLDRQRQALLALVEMRQQDREPRGELTTDLHRYAHARIPHQQAPKTENGTLFPASFGGSGSVAAASAGTPARPRRSA